MAQKVDCEIVIRGRWGCPHCVGQYLQRPGNMDDPFELVCPRCHNRYMLGIITPLSHIEIFAYVEPPPSVG